LPDTDFTTAVDMIAARSVALRYGAPRMTKEAMEKTAILQQLGKWYGGLSPVQQKMLLGAGGGAALGLGSQLLRDKEDRQYGHGALTGLMAGGALVGGLGVASKYWPKSTPDPNALPAGQFEFNGKVYKLKPGAKMPTPEELNKLTDLKSQSEGSSWLGNIAESTGKGIWNQAVAENPITAATAGAIAAGKGAASSSSLRKKAPWLEAFRGGPTVSPGQGGTLEHLRKGMGDLIPGTEAMKETKIPSAARLNDPTVKAEGLKHGKGARIPLSVDELRAVTKLQEYAAIPKYEAQLRQYLTTRDPNVLDQMLRLEAAPILNNQGKLNSIIESGAGTLAKDNTFLMPPRLRPSRLYRGVNWLERMAEKTPGLKRAVKPGPVSWGAKLGLRSHVPITFSRSGLARGLSRWAPLLLMAAAERGGWGALRRHQASNEYTKQLEQYAEPVQ